MDETRLTNEDIARIWERVYPGSEQAEREVQYSEAKDAERLRGFIDSARQNAENYTFLAQKSRYTPEEGTLRRMSNDEAQGEKLFCAEYFMLTGDTYTPKASPNVRGGMLSALRAQYIAEMSAEESLRRAADTSQNEHTAAVCRETANTKKRHALQLRAMIDRQIQS